MRENKFLSCLVRREKYDDFFCDTQAFSSLTLCLVGWILGGMENIKRKMGQKNGFSSVWEWEENRRSGISGRKFSLLGPRNFSSQIGRKSNERKLPHCSFTVMPSHQPAFMPFTYTPDDFCLTKSLSLFSSSHLYLQHQWSR